MSMTPEPGPAAAPPHGTDGSPAQAPDRIDTSPAPSGRAYVLVILAAICLANLALYAKFIANPYLAMDDFQILVRSWTWQRTWDELWVPANEHAMPAGRLTTWALVRLAGRASAVPPLAAWQGPLAALAGVLLLYLFVRRELGHPLYGLVAAALFGASTVYEQAVYWFSSSFSVLTLDTLLLALLAAQGWRRTGRAVYLVLCAAGTALAPTWFASGALAGPLCALYLLPPEGGRRWAALVRSGLAAVVPLVGTGLFLAVSLPRTADAILHLPHYGDKTALESFHPLLGLKHTLWSVVENLLLGSVGISRVNVPFRIAVAVWPLLLGAGVWWWRGAPAGRRLMLLGLGTVFTSYLLVYSARADWGYEGWMNQPQVWSRYHLLPQLGLALFVAGGLPRRAGRWELRAGSALSPRQARVLLGLIAVLGVTQFPRAFWTEWGGAEAAEQRQVLRHIDEVDALCRAHRIGKATARRALGRLEVPGCLGREDGWELLWGSPDPDPAITPEEARHLLRPDP
jgi:hypothetical protein